MIDGPNIDSVLTEDEIELVTIINGLEEQADQKEYIAQKVKQTYNLFAGGSVTFLGLSFLEKGTLNKAEYLVVSTGLIIGGLERVIKERKLIHDIRSKNILASRLKQELEPADLDRYEQRNDPYYEEDEDDDYQDDGWYPV